MVMATLADIGDALAEPVSKAIETIKGWTGVIRRIIKQNKELVVSFAKIVAVLGIVGGGLISIGVAASVIAFAFGGLASIISAVATAFGILAAVIGTILTPLGLVIAGIVSLTAYILYATETGAKALDWLSEKFSILKTTAVSAWKGIGDALAAGDIALAAKILWTSLKMEWQRGIHFLNGLWIKFKEFFMSIATDAFYGTATLLVDAWAGLQVAWVETVTFLQNIWTGFTTGLQRAWNSTQNYLAKGWLELRGLFDEGLDVEAAQKRLDKMAGREDQQILSGAGQTLKERERVLQEQRTGIEQERIGTLGAIVQMADEEDRNRQRQYLENLKASEIDLNNARNEWKKAIAEAATKRVKSEAEKKMSDKAEKKIPSAADIMEDLQNKIKNIGTAIDTAAKKSLDVDISGTFSAEAADRMGLGANTAERTAKATEETAKNTKRIVREMGDNQLSFA
jgi:hypothetical protein